MWLDKQQLTIRAGTLICLFVRLGEKQEKTDFK